MLPGLLEGPFNIFLTSVGTLGYGLEGLAEVCLVEGVGCGGLGDEGGHFLDACPVGLLAFWVVPLENGGLLATVAAGAVQGLGG